MDGTSTVWRKRKYLICIGNISDGIFSSYLFVHVCNLTCYEIEQPFWSQGDHSLDVELFFRKEYLIACKIFRSFQEFIEVIVDENFHQEGLTNFPPPMDQRVI